MNKKKLVLITTCAVLSLGLLYGCSSNQGKELSSNIVDAKKDVAGIVDTERNLLTATGDWNKFDSKANKDTEVSKTEIATKSSRTKTMKTKEIPMVKLPEGIKGIKAETKPNKDLEALIAQEYDIPKEELGQTKYFYNYVNLNNDEYKEIFVVIMGPYTSGTGGDSGLWVVENQGQLYVNQRFTLANVPFIISDKVTNGYHDLIVPYNGGGAMEGGYKVLTCNEGSYENAGQAKSIDNLKGITGKAIIANDMLKEIENGSTGISLKD